MKKLSLLVTLIALGLPALGNAQAVLRVATDGGFPPYSEVGPDGKLKGFDVDIAQALCAEMKATCDISRYDFDGMIPALNSRKFDLIVASMAITPERQRAVAFSDKYQGGYSQLLVRKGRQLTGTPAGMAGHTIGVQRGSIQANYTKDKFATAGAKVREYVSPESAFMDLQAGRVDAILVEIGVAHALLKGSQGSTVERIGPKYDDPAYFGTGSGIAMRKADKDLLVRVNTALATMLRNGTYKKINDRYFDYNQYE